MDWLRQIPIGQYVDGTGSWLRDLDPRLKLAWTVAFLLTPILAGPWWRLALVGLLLLVTACSGLPWRIWRRTLPLLLALSVLVGVLATFLPAGGVDLVALNRPPQELRLAPGDQGQRWELLRWGPVQLGPVPFGPPFSNVWQDLHSAARRSPAFGSISWLPAGIAAAAVAVLPFIHNNRVSSPLKATSPPAVLANTVRGEKRSSSCGSTAWPRTNAPATGRPRSTTGVITASSGCAGKSAGR